MPFLLFVSGASGAGKTATLQQIKDRLPERRVSILHFDSMGIPSPEEMVRQAGSLEQWQEAATHAWLERIQREFTADEIVLFEGQSNLNFVLEGCARLGLSACTPVLLDCDWETRVKRLVQRGQPELASSDMKNWSDFLRNQAVSKGIRIVDTTHQSVATIADLLIALVPLARLS